MSQLSIQEGYMYFFEPLYRQLESQYSDKINHFPLIRLILYSLDHALFLFLIWLCIWVVLVWIRHRNRMPIHWRREHLKNGCIFYMLLLFQLTVFRNSTTIFTVKIIPHSLSDIYLIPFEDSYKLFFGDSLFSAYYNVLGNIIWFVPLGIFVGALSRKEKNVWRALVTGFTVSFTIETMQFLFYTGIAHIDDLLLNIVGTLLGYVIYAGIKKIRKKRNKHGNNSSQTTSSREY